MLWRSTFSLLGINVFFLILFLLFGVVRYGSLDDYFMATVLSGAYGAEFDPHLVFVNVIVAYLLRPLFYLFPDVGWLYIFEMWSIFASFSIFSYFLIRKLGRGTGIPFALLLASLSLEFYAQVSFTQCAALLVSAGGLFLLFGCKEKRTIFLFAGILFLVLGAALRWQMFLLSLPFLVIAFGLLSNLRQYFNIKVGLTLFLCLISLFSIRVSDESFYTTPEYQYYKAYQGKRSLFGDGRHFDKEAVFDELEERGMQGRDFQLLNEWTFYDTDVFSIDSLDKIIQIVNRNAYPINKARIPTAIALAISNAFMQNITWCWSLFCIYLLLLSERRSHLYPWFSLLAVVLGYFYLFSLNRLADHVEMGLWLYATVLVIPLMHRRKLQRISFEIYLLAIGFTLVGIFSLPRIDSPRHIVSVPEKSESWQLFLNYARMNSDDVFLLSFARYKDLGMVKDPAYKAPAPGSWENIFPIGYWNIHLPAMKKELKKRGVENPLRDIISHNVFLLESNNQPQYLDFYKVHYQKILNVDTVAVFGELMLLKYYDKGGMHE